VSTSEEHVLGGAVMGLGGGTIGTRPDLWYNCGQYASRE